MDIKEILAYVDHTLLSPDATFEEVKLLCDDAIEYNAASVCIAPSFVKATKEYVKNKIKICTVIGFPNGYNTTHTKCFETTEAVNNGADEIDMVINIGYVKEGDFSAILEEINAVKDACKGRTLKVIIETCLLTDEEKIKLCQIVSKSNADYIKTSTGFSNGGATRDDIELFSKYISDGLKIKAAGGISSLQDAEEFIKLGASRLGTSRIVTIVKNSGDHNEYNKNTSY